MKRTFLVLGLAVVSVCLLATVAQAQSVVGSRHDMSGRVSGSGDNGAVCVYCHTPHGGNQSVGPLWNRKASTATYTPYSSTTINMTIETTAQVGSSLCMSCHDGSIAINVIVNAPTTQSGVYGSALTAQNYSSPNGAAFATLDDALDSAELGYFGTDLTDQHPIGVLYDTTASGDTAFNAAASGKVGSLPLYGGSSDHVECQTCHDVHNYTNIPFLRVSNSASALCTTCHKK